MNKFIGFKKEEIEKTITERFEKIVSLYPEQVAIKTKIEVINYDKLNKLANRLSRKIIAVQGNIFKQPIILLFENQELFIPSILGVLKTGNIYVALMPSLPEKRLSQTLANSEARLIITDSESISVAEKLAQGTIKIINIDNLEPELDDRNLDLEFPENLPAAIFFTSGSTGDPKGILLNHRSILHTLWVFTHQQTICVNDRICSLYQFYFIPSLFSMFRWLLNGGTVYLYDLKRQGIETFSNWLIQEEINYVHFITSVFRNWLDLIPETVSFPKLKIITVGGEKIYKTDVERFWQLVSSECKLRIGYGSSETGPISDLYLERHSLSGNDIVPVGYPIEDKEILLLDETGKPVEANEIGEIAVKSRYISQGYWKNPQLTQEKFLPVADDKEARIYLTGDLGRFNSDGCLEFLGRKDSQIKIRGFRVELAEIEVNLKEHPQIKQTLVLAKGDNPEDKKLIAYFIPKETGIPSPKELREFLISKLPDYMIPSAFVSLTSFPLTPNGKIDIQALQEPDWTLNLDAEFIAPRTLTEKTLASIWTEVLDIENIGIKDNFFYLGGNSLLGTKVIVRITERFGIPLVLNYLFESPTIEGLANIIETIQNNNFQADESEELFMEEGVI